MTGNPGIATALTNNFLGDLVKRFVKSDGKSLQTDKMTFSTEIQFDKATVVGSFIDRLHYQSDEFLQQGMRMIRRYRCQIFGHISSNCLTIVTFKHWWSGRYSVYYSKGNQAAKCANCALRYERASLAFPTYNEEVLIIHEENLYKQQLRKRLDQKLMLNSVFTSLLIMISSLSGNSKTAKTNTYIKLKLIFFSVNEMDANHFDNSTTNCLGGKSRCVAIM